MARLFISHSWNDRELAERVKQALNARGHSAFLDRDILDVGADWGATIQDAMSAADGVLALLTNTSLASEFVLSECGAALARRHADPSKFLIPVRVPDVGLPNFLRHLMIATIHPENAPQFEADADGISRSIANHAERVRKVSATPRLFVSHRHIDAEVASALVACLRARFEIDARDIRCTSLHPYRLRAGEDTERRLREEVSRAEVVLGVLSPVTTESSFVMFELGAAWGGNVYTCPLLVNGATQEHLPHPIRGRHPLDLSQAADCFQLLEDLESRSSLKRSQRPGDDEQVRQCVDQLVRVARPRDAR